MKKKKVRKKVPDEKVLFKTVSFGTRWFCGNQFKEGFHLYVFGVEGVVLYVLRRECVNAFWQSLRSSWWPHSSRNEMRPGKTFFHFFSQQKSRMC